MARIEIYCRNCLRFLRFGPNSESAKLRWIERCEWCEEREAGKREAAPRVLLPRECAAGCGTLFIPATTRHAFCSDRCRKRAHRRSKAPGATSSTRG
jgi:hypothetical protein